MPREVKVTRTQPPRDDTEGLLIQLAAALQVTQKHTSEALRQHAAAIEAKLEDIAPELLDELAGETSVLLSTYIYGGNNMREIHPDNHNLGICPDCDSHDVTEVQDMDRNYPLVTRCTCNTCGTTWEECYTLRRVLVHKQ